MTSTAPAQQKTDLGVAVRPALKHKLRRGRLRPQDTPESTETADSLYIMENSLLPGIVKIGRSTNPEERAKQLGASHPFRLTVQYSYGGKGFLEKTLHNRLKHRRVDGGNGREWFRISPEQADILVRGSIVEHELSPTDE